MADDLDALLCQIPRGKVTTYGALARALGHVNAARWIGERLAHHPCADECPCHRVVRTGGDLGLYASGDPNEKRQRLLAEGHRIADDRVELEGVFFDDFQCDRPLERLADLQTALRGHAFMRRRTRVPRLIAGVDASYPREDLAVGAYTLVDSTTGELVWSTMIEREAPFPYITGFLAFRELPVVLDLIDAARAADRLADITLVDGSGMLHPRGAGIACHLGVLQSIATIGVTKKLLCGRVQDEAIHADGSRAILHEDRRLGVAVPPTPGSANPLFVSPGHRIDVDHAAAIVRQTLFTHRLPEPIYWADRLSREEGKRLIGT